MPSIDAEFVGVELYFDDLERAQSFYTEVLGLKVAEQGSGHHAKFDSRRGFICLERKGVESYPSKDKAVLFFQVPDLKAAMRAIGEEKLVEAEGTWAVLHDPEGHNVVLLEKAR